MTTLASTRYPLATTTWDQAEYQAMQRVMDTGNFTMGGEVQAFETQFAQAVGSTYAVMVNSGSSANLLMVAALFYRQNNRLKPGDEVIVPAVSWATTYYPLTQYGLTLKFVDIDAHTLNLDLTALNTAITPKTRAILAVNLLGNPIDYGQLQSVIGDRDIILLEDNCESLGATLNHQQAGTFGLMGTYSSFFSHHISTMEGGLIVTQDEELYHLLLSLRSHGWTRHLPQKNHVSGTKSDDPFEESFNFVLPGYNVRPGELHGALGIEQLKKLPGLITARRQNAQYFQTLFTNHPHVMIQQEVGQSSWFGFSLVLKPFSSQPQQLATLKGTRKQLSAYLAAHGVECRPIVAGNFTKNPVMKWLPHTIHQTLPNAEWIDHGGLFVGNHHFDLRPQLDHLHQLLQDFSFS
jgi:CDP-4-dehydro-6-deoxyglucose reductase, E1